MLFYRTMRPKRPSAAVAGVRIAELRTDCEAQGPLRQTGNPLDMALYGDGFFAVQAPGGTRYTRDGQFTMDAQGRLATTTGYLVLGTDGKPITVGGDPKTTAVARTAPSARAARRSAPSPSCR